MTTGALTSTHSIVRIAGNTDLDFLLLCLAKDHRPCRSVNGYTRDTNGGTKEREGEGDYRGWGRDRLNWLFTLTIYLNRGDCVCFLVLYLKLVEE